jgi:hypothetical protein
MSPPPRGIPDKTSAPRGSHATAGTDLLEGCPPAWLLGRRTISARPCPWHPRRSSPSGASRPVSRRSPIRWNRHPRRSRLLGLLTRAAATLAAHALLRACRAGLIEAWINSHNTPQPAVPRQIRDREPRRAACLVLGAGSAASLASWAAGSPDRQCVAGVWQPLSACPVAASRRGRALRERCGRAGSPLAGSSSGETAIRPASSIGPDLQARW